MQLNTLFHDWLSRRKITDAVMEQFNLHDIDHPTIGKAIAIPVVDQNGVFLFNKIRRSPLDEQKPKYLYEQGGKVSLYGYNFAKDAKTILITEGEIDCLVAWSHNIPAVTSTGGAQSFQKEWGELFLDKEVILCFDNDTSGGEGMAKTLDIIPHAKLLFLPDRPGIKDISDYVSNGGDLNDLLKTAIRLESIEKICENMADRASVWQSTHFHEAYIRLHQEVKRSDFVRDDGVKDKVSRAKEYPITDLLRFTRNKAKCPFHNEKTPSLVYYALDNHCYCFGSCGKAYDSISIYMKLHNCKFLEAVEKLQ